MANTPIKCKFVTNSKSDGYKVVLKKVLNWTFKGR